MERHVISPVDLRPSATTDQAEQLALERFGLRARARPLDGERDGNFRIETEEGRRFVLKLANPADDSTALELQNAALERAASRAAGFAFGRPAVDLEGRTISEVEVDGERVLLRLLEWVPGVPLAGISPRPPELLEGIGRMMACVDTALDGMESEEADRELYWDLVGATALIDEILPDLEDAATRGVVEALARRCAERLDPLVPELRVGMIHNDANDHNVIVSRPEPGSTVRITGLIDFGDMVRSWIAAEPAVAAAYAMLDARDPSGAAASVARGYVGAAPILEPEIDALYDLAVLRLCLSAAVAAYQQKLNPANEYLGISQRAVRALLPRLAGESPDLARYRIRAACGLEPCPASKAVVGWLSAPERELAAVVDADLETAPVYDLGVASLELDQLDDPDDTEAATRQLFDRMRHEGAQVVIGRYAETRWFYRSDAYRPDRDAEPGEWRTLHLGADLFAEPGTPVYSPLDGTVYGFADHAQRLDYGPTVVLEHADETANIRFWTLYGHLSRDSLDGLEVGRRVAAGETVGRIGDRPENGDWPPHLHLQIVVDPLGARSGFPGVARPRDRATWCSISPDPNLILRVPGGIAAEEPRATVDMLAARHRHIGPNLSVSYVEPLHIVRGRGTRLYDADGQPYLDAVNNVPHVGHAHPRVAEAARRQNAVLNTNTRYLHENMLRYTERLTATLPDGLDVCFLVNSGSEANELALRLARAATGGLDLVVLEGGYHGNTGGLVEISHYKFAGPGGGGPAGHVHVAPMPDVYRGPHRCGPDADGREAAMRYAAGVAEACERVEAGGRPLAGMIAEALIGCGGQIVPPDGYLAAAFEHVRAAGGVCIADEVQVGFGRSGSHFWAFETQGTVPDIVTLGKPIGNGHPLGAVVTTREIADAFDTGMEYFNTFGGNPVSCAIGLAVLDVIEDEGLQQNARRVGARLLGGLRGLMDAHPLIGDARGLGLDVGAELVLDRETREPAPAHAAHLANRMKELGVLISTDGPDQNVLKIKPPICFSDDDADRLVRTLDRVLGESALRVG